MRECEFSQVSGCVSRQCCSEKITAVDERTKERHTKKTDRQTDRQTDKGEKLKRTQRGPNDCQKECHRAVHSMRPTPIGASPARKMNRGEPLFPSP
jgi:predicted secreted protein